MTLTQEVWKQRSTSQSDICDKVHPGPAMEKAGWHGMDQI